MPELNDIGPLTSVCEHCHALKFEDKNHSNVVMKERYLYQI